ncbi:hypothetical protein EGR_10101 [Echinococcus granulosus]|uniref:Uncharacterized protein n=1 Tax=Echinococcus granulosus TaxID=6210 RepID=W6UNT5_ECHGR|nr:hypothetical protein EGR_10101 [Echinococcus granulosus]EUB55029.1 hypothetical protein EGR_10101 [Echinococcus granulosus]
MLNLGSSDSYSLVEIDNKEEKKQIWRLDHFYESESSSSWVKGKLKEGLDVAFHGPVMELGMAASRCSDATMEELDLCMPMETRR